MGAKRKKKKQKRKKEKPSSGGAKSDSASDSQEFKVRNDGYYYDVFQPEQPSTLNNNRDNIHCTDPSRLE